MDSKITIEAPDDASAFIPAEQIVPFAGENITVTPLDLEQVIILSQTLKSVLPALDRMQVLLDSADGTADEPGADQIAIVVELLADYGMPLTEGIAIAIGKPVAFVRKAKDYAGLIALVAAIVKVNASFFAQQAGPRLAGLRNMLANGAGQTPSTASAAPATH